MKKEDLESFIQQVPVACYTGVGSRKTPRSVGLLMCAIAIKFQKMGWTLRSGAADGADLAFESGVLGDKKPKEIYLPEPGFNGSQSHLERPSKECYEIAGGVHKNWSACNGFSLHAHARNVHQVLGADLKHPTGMVICWTEDGAVDDASAKQAGGTRTAIVLAHRNGIPVFNLQRQHVADVFKAWVGEDLLAQAEKHLKMSGRRKPAFVQKSMPSTPQKPPEQPSLFEDGSSHAISPSPAKPNPFKFRSSR